jgi:hypothetical protein
MLGAVMLGVVVVIVVAPSVCPIKLRTKVINSKDDPELEGTEAINLFSFGAAKIS